MRPQVNTYRTRVHAAAPQAVAIAAGLGRLFGRAIRGHNGAIRYGYPSQQTNRLKYGGYVTPPQLFIGYTAKNVAGGSVRVPTPAIPTSTQVWSMTDSPLVRSMATVTAGQLQKRGHG